MRQVLKAVAGRMLGGGVANRRIRRRHCGDSLVLAFHNVVPDNEPARGDRSLHLPVSVFVEFIDRLLEILSPCGLEQAFLPAESPRLAITFDDAYRGALTLALPELYRRGIPSTVFVPTARLGNADFWWDVLATEDGVLDPASREHAMQALQGDDALIRAWAREEGRRLTSMPDLWRSATVDELIAASTLKGVALAPHSASHRALDRLDENELQHELRSPLDWFRTHGLRHERTVAYPYGSWSPSVLAAAEAEGYEAGWLVSGGWTTPRSTNRFMMPRMNIPAGGSVPMLMLRVAELVGS